MEMECTKDLEQLVSEVIVHEENNTDVTDTEHKELAVIIEENIEPEADSDIVIETFATDEAMMEEGIDSNLIETCTMVEDGIEPNLIETCGVEVEGIGSNPVETCAMVEEGIESNLIETCATADEPMITETVVEQIIDENLLVENSESNTSNNDSQEQPAAITTAITTIISHFVSEINIISCKYKSIGCRKTMLENYQ